MPFQESALQRPKKFSHMIMGSTLENYLHTFANGIVFILSGIHPENNMQIIEQSGQIIIFKLKNVDFPFQNGPLYGGVTYEDYLEFSEGTLSTLANHMNLSFSYEITPENWYKVTLKAN